ncbi:hypothetical protein AVL62_15945 [Serinicoccus chungangensis]|uniref:Uncharacterized protein n=1 Tax=Serinicoccus chungangensis TaxID=767452 RepID=A0A0W8ICV9_9MICO|nr:hypothetical protein [Serinicoccus chungangensis]KUG57616.1 hypothetical protein AVL62_15945 [Serinicoccus chungangensis]
MTVVQTLTRSEAEAERDELLAMFDTEDRDLIRDALLSGLYDDVHAQAARRLAHLDFLLG